MCHIGNFIRPGEPSRFPIVDEFVIFDETQNLYWMLDANYAMIVESSPDGKMTWGNSHTITDCNFYSIDQKQRQGHETLPYPN
jgi:hypothetical protein